ncbi:MAG: AbgT family transporter [Prevotella sp.]|nr:AbgT family transporter [Prevotella sp.]
MKKSEKAFAYVALILVIAQVAVILVSWIVTAATQALPMRSLLSSEGIRWFFGEFVSNLASPLLVWMLLAAIAYGALRSSGLLQALRGDESHEHRNSFRHRFALKIVVAEVILYVCIILILTCIPHAVLLSSTGHLFPSSFSQSLVPVITFGVVLVSVTYGLLSSTLSSVVDVFHSLTIGVSYLLPWWFIYVLAVQLWYTICFVFML